MGKFTWKKAFLTLLTVNLAVILLIIGFIFIPKESSKPRAVSTTLEGTPVDVQFEKDDLTNLINYYLSDHQPSTPEYHVEINEFIELHGEIQVFNQGVPMHLSFDPFVTESGDILLKQTSIHIGNIEIPVRYVLNLIDKSYDFPNWVEIFSNEEYIYLHLSEIKINDHYQIKAKEFDLDKDHIVFTILLAGESS